MIHFGFNLSNPFQKYQWNILFHKEEVFRPNKAYNIQVTRDKSIIGFDFNWACRTDHAGVSITLSLFNHRLDLDYYDTRHWDDERSRFAIYDDKGELI